MKKTLFDTLVGFLFLAVIAALIGMVIIDFDRHSPVKPGTGFTLTR